MRKTLLSTALGLFYLALLVIGGWYVWKLQGSLNTMTQKMDELSLDLDRTKIVLSEYENAHGSAQIDIGYLEAELRRVGNLVNKQEMLINDQDLLIESLGFQVIQ